jgi:hypothetical protein
VLITTPSYTERIGVPSGAAKSIPRWFVDAPAVGAVRGPKPSVMSAPGASGQKTDVGAMTAACSRTIVVESL